MANIFEVRLHGRGGQGAVTAAELIAVAAFHDGRHTQAFPNFGVERRGAPVEAFVRLSDRPIRSHAQIYEPDFLIIQDATLLGSTDVLRGLKKGGGVLINAEKNIWPEIKEAKVYTVPITKLAMEILGRPVTNTGLLAAFAKITGLIKKESLEAAIRERFAAKPDILKKNLELIARVEEAFKK